jgi:hypothetical protein
LARAKEKKLRRWERLEQYNEEYRLREQQGLSPPPALANSSSDDEEESDRERTTSNRWEHTPLSPRAEGAVVELVPVAGVDLPTARLSEEAPTGATETPTGAAEVPLALKEEEAGILQFEVSSASPRAFDFEGQSLTLSLLSLTG